MGLFTRKPNRALQAEFSKQATNVVNWFGCALRDKETNPRAGMEDAAVDLTIQDNRDAIKDELIRLIRQHQLQGCTEAEIGGIRLLPLVMDQSRTPIEDAALCSALAINSINLITRSYYEDFPKDRPLFEMVDNLANMGCSGAAQPRGPDLPPEVIQTWPYFSRIFAEAKQSNTLLWPDV